ncbi:Uncharacterised protein [Mycobacterium tuberculosis]|uniref:Uncharacterized protein n=1 Tax=Mycobacterium tuberculosis TaxID=1773 RepID=A0A0U0U389_MYCTX|nr:Uncharacterised protein [Mycobacterium tuberculosis]CKR94164.1 Uncharacterised protein [Mycobacterium tuberculosis]CKS34659.1 Uncharacterised protein [Mycobacterium tuberculosis]COX39887.1 Uncharacterised protein [Mycobacterium tuberculosis]COY44372.1 Uncharacterised protein [Mycobacterium tuberculosis]
MADHVAGAVMSLREVAKGREDVVWHVAHVVVDPPDPLGIRHRVPDEGCCRRTNERMARVEVLRGRQKVVHAGSIVG